MNIVDPRIDPKLVPENSRPVVINSKPEPVFQDLPAIVTPNGYVISRWEPTEHERARILAGEDIFVSLIVNPRAVVINPLIVSVGTLDWTKVL